MGYWGFSEAEQVGEEFQKVFMERRKCLDIGQWLLESLAVGKGQGGSELG